MSDFKEVPVPAFQSPVDIALEELARAHSVNPLTLKGDIVRSHTRSGIRLSKHTLKQLEREGARKEKLRASRAEHKRRKGRPCTPYWAKRKKRLARTNKWYASLGRWTRLSRLDSYDRFVLSCKSGGLVPAISRSEWVREIEPVVADLVGYEVRRHRTDKLEVELYDIYIRVSGQGTRGGKTVVWDGTELRMRELGYIY